MVGLYPEIEPYDHGMLDTGDGNLVYWEICGNPNGKAAVVLHGGPGSGCTATMRRYLDPRAYRVVLFDQRGAGRSKPHASHPATVLSNNTTHHLIAVMELLRQHLAIPQWLVYGVSWGSTLALAFAERHSDHVSEIVLLGVTNTTRREVEWLTRDVGRLFPEQWARLRDGVPSAERDGNLAEAYARLLSHPNAGVREKAAKDWCEWEDALVMVRPEHRPNPRYDDPAFRLGFARLVTHYFSHAAWLEDGSLLRDAGKLSGIPGVLIHGRLDLSSPLETAWKLARAWPGSELVVVDEAGHLSSDPGMGEAVVNATDRFAKSI